MNITILAFYDRISLYHSLQPFLNQPGPWKFHITNSSDYCLKKDRNKILFMVRWFLKPDIVDVDLLARLRDKYSKIIFFNDNAGGGIHRPQILPFVDLFYNKALFKNRSLYEKPLYGGELYSDYYHNHYSIIDTHEKIVPGVDSPENLAKLRLSWNVGYGEFPRHKYRQRFGVAAARYLHVWASKPFMRQNKLYPPQNSGEFDINARIGYQDRETISYQRQLHMEKLNGIPGVLLGKVPQAQFNKEIHNSKIMFSPFGWGELCFRDFEAVLSGSVLVKPDMSHLETWPDIFIPHETYVPVQWDGKNLVEVCNELLRDEAFRKRITANAYEVFIHQHNYMSQRFVNTMEEILSLP